MTEDVPIDEKEAQMLREQARNEEMFRQVLVGNCCTVACAV